MKIKEYNGVKIMGDRNILNKFLFQPQIFMQKICLILLITCLIKKKNFEINSEDEIIK